MAVERSELRLVWPPALFSAEARALLHADADDDALGGLLVEAFAEGRGEELLQRVAREQPYTRPAPWDDDPWAVSPTAASAPDPGPSSSRATARLLLDLARDAGDLPRHAPRLLFRQRQQSTRAVVLSVAACKDRFARLVIELTMLGYFEDAFGSQCSDARDDNPDWVGQRTLAERLDLDDVALWPLHSWVDGVAIPSKVHAGWADEVFFDVVEALDEVVARPRGRSWHSYHREWDYFNYSRPGGQAIYRWRVNEVLDRSEVPLRLAQSGDDAGLLVHAVGDPRDELTDRAMTTSDPRDRAEVRHAVALFRGRSMSREEKRSAIITLARVLEERRPLVEASLTKKDAGALFQIGNEFDLRHRRAASHGKAQRDDYDDAFLDWIYWWYLSTVELTNQLLLADGAPTSP